MVHYPFDGGCHCIKYRRARAEAKWQDTVVVVLPLPQDAEEMPILWADRYLTKSTLHIEFREIDRRRGGHNDVNGFINADVLQRERLGRDPVVNAGAGRAGQVVYQA